MKNLLFINNYDECISFDSKTRRVKVEIELLTDNTNVIDNFTNFIYDLDNQFKNFIKE